MKIFFSERKQPYRKMHTMHIYVPMIFYFNYLLSFNQNEYIICVTVNYSNNVHILV
jgi:hypothetical protein